MADYIKGIPDELKEKLFTRYFPASAGCGLGMSIVNGLLVDR